MIVTDEELAKWEKTFNRKKFEGEVQEVLNRHDLPEHLRHSIMGQVQNCVRHMVYHANEMRRKYEEAEFRNWKEKKKDKA